METVGRITFDYSTEDAIQKINDAANLIVSLSASLRKIEALLNKFEIDVEKRIQELIDDKKAFREALRNALSVLQMAHSPGGYLVDDRAVLRAITLIENALEKEQT